MSDAPDARRHPGRRRLVLVVVAVVAALAAVLGASAWTALGNTPSGQRLARMAQSPNFADGEFRNPVPSHMLTPGTFWQMATNQFLGDEIRAPETPPPVVRLTQTAFAQPPASGLRITWFGHATSLVEIDGRRILTDPVFSERVSPLDWLGPQRFFPLPMGIDELPPIDAVVISHDHYDHLDHRSIVQLAAKTGRFVVPLGIGAHLAYWGIPAAQIVELDWWEDADLGDGMRLMATPARHYSGRGLLDGNATLWASWAMLGPQHRVFYSGDTGYMQAFAEIGARLGPFDAALVKAGAYDASWADIHMMPEHTVAVARDVGAKLLIPVHWGTFNLAQHGWTEPAERVLAAAQARGARVAVPRPGAFVEPSDPPPVVRWWPRIPWRPAAPAAQ